LKRWKRSRWRKGDAGSLLLNSRYRSLRVVALPFRILVALVGQTNPQASVLFTEVQVEVLAASFQTHPLMIVRHLLQVNGCANGDNLVKRRSSHPAIRLGFEFQENSRPFAK